MGEIKLDLAHVFGMAMVKYVKAERKYGDFDAATDTRDLLDEAEQELLDAINYLAMQVIKLREIKMRHEAAQDMPENGRCMP